MTVTDLLSKDGREMEGTFKQKKHKGPLPLNYRPELDDTLYCSDEHASWYQQIIGILRWAIELGQLDFHYEVSIMSQYQADPRGGLLGALYLIVHYLMKHPFKLIIFDPTDPGINDNLFNDIDWTNFYGNDKEEDPQNMPKPLFNPVTITCFVDADHAGN